MTAEIIQFKVRGDAPRRCTWVCPVCGRTSSFRWPTYDEFWTNACADVAIVCEIETLIAHPLTGRIISLKGDNGWKYHRVQELTRQISLQTGRRLFHP